MTTACTHFHPALAPARTTAPAWLTAVLRALGVGR